MAAANGAPPSYNLIGFNGNQWRYDAKYRSAGAGNKTRRHCHCDAAYFGGLSIPAKTLCKRNADRFGERLRKGVFHISTLDQIKIAYIGGGLKAGPEA